jgi:uncharacterized Zn finger protein (UPF0148 family)
LSLTSANEIHHYSCSSCGADLLFEPQDGFLTCPYCGHREAISESSEPVEEQSWLTSLEPWDLEASVFLLNFAAKSDL